LGSFITETRTFAFAVRFVAPVAKAAGAFSYLRTRAGLSRRCGRCEVLGCLAALRCRLRALAPRLGTSATMRLSSSLAP